MQTRTTFDQCTLLPTKGLQQVAPCVLDADIRGERKTFPVDQAMFQRATETPSIVTRGSPNAWICS